jgi:osmotically-inducible protein OsmY
MRARSALIVSLSLGLAAGAACRREPDLKQQVTSALQDAKVQAVDVDLDRRERIVHLRGTVTSTAERTRAEEVATAAVGTTGRVLNELTVRGVNDDTADDLDDDVRDALRSAIDRDPNLEQRDIDFDVHNGAVTVKGTVRSVEEKNRVSEIVRAAPGVKDMANGLEVKPER